MTEVAILQAMQTHALVAQLTGSNAGMVVAIFDFIWPIDDVSTVFQIKTVIAVVCILAVGEAISTAIFAVEHLRIFAWCLQEQRPELLLQRCQFAMRPLHLLQSMQVFLFV